MDGNLLQQLDNRLGNIEELLSEKDKKYKDKDDEASDEESDEELPDNCVKICSQDKYDDVLNNMNNMNQNLYGEGMINPMMNPAMMNHTMMNPAMMNHMMMNPMMNPATMNPAMMNPAMMNHMMMNPMMMNPMMMNSMMNPMMNPQLLYNNPMLNQTQEHGKPLGYNMFNTTRSRQYRPKKESKTKKNKKVIIEDVSEAKKDIPDETQRNRAEDDESKITKNPELEEMKKANEEANEEDTDREEDEE